MDESAGDVLKRLREARNYSQDDLGAIVGRSGGLVSHWETGRSAPKRAYVIRLDSILAAGGELLDAYGYVVNVSSPDAGALDRMAAQLRSEIAQVDERLRAFEADFHLQLETMVQAVELLAAQIGEEGDPGSQ